MKIYASQGGRDENDGLSSSTPVRTLGKASSILRANDTLLLRGNFFDPLQWYNGPLTVTNYEDIPTIYSNGQSPIQMGGYGNWDISNLILIGDGAENNELHGLEISCWDEAENINVNALEVFGFGQRGIRIGTSLKKLTSVSVKNCWVHDCAVGIFVGYDDSDIRTVYNLLVEDNLIERCGLSVNHTRLPAGYGTYLSNVSGGKISGNGVYNCGINTPIARGHAGISCNCSDNLLIELNIVNGTLAHTDDGITNADGQALSNNGLHNSIIRKNLLSENNVGIELRAEFLNDKLRIYCTNVDVYSNLLINNNVGVGLTRGVFGNTSVQQNTILAAPGGMCLQIKPALNGPRFINNLLGLLGSGWHVWSAAHGLVTSNGDLWGLYGNYYGGEFSTLFGAESALQTIYRHIDIYRGDIYAEMLNYVAVGNGGNLPWQINRGPVPSPTTFRLPVGHLARICGIEPTRFGLAPVLDYEGNEFPTGVTGAFA